MSSDARMVATNGEFARTIPLDKRWLGMMVRMGFGQRTAAVGQPILSEVAILSVVEAQKVNESYRSACEANLKAYDADRPANPASLRHVCTRALDCAEQVDDLLTAIGKVEYHSPLVISRNRGH